MLCVRHLIGIVWGVDTTLVVLAAAAKSQEVAAAAVDRTCFKFN